MDQYHFPLHRLADANNRNRKLQDEINHLQRALGEKEKENADLKAKNNAMAREMDHLIPGAKENDELRKKSVRDITVKGRGSVK